MLARRAWRRAGLRANVIDNAAVASGAGTIVTSDERDFESGDPLPVRLATPQEFLRMIEVPK